MFRRIGNGFKIMISTLKFAFKHPVFLIPFLFSLIFILLVNGSILMYLPNDSTTNAGYIGIGILVLFVTSFFIAIAQLVLLELLEQHEKDGELNLFKAIGEALGRDLIRALPIIVVWSLVQYLIALLDALVSGRDSHGRRSLLGSILSRLLRGIKRGLHWGVMLIYAALAWEEELKPGAAYQKAKRVYKDNFVEMLTGISISGIVYLLFLVPLIIVLILAQNGTIILGLGFFIGFLVWFVIIWALNMIVEQVFTAELYLWYRVYESQIEEAKRTGSNGPTSIYDVDKPSFFDDVPDMVIRRDKYKDSQLDY